MGIEELRDKYDIRIDDLEEFTRIQVKEDENQDFYQELIEYVKNCSTKISIANGIVGNATREDFLQGEEIIEKIVKEIQPNWTKKQIVAYVHYKIGELISYVPDFNFNGMFVNSANSKDTRNIWKSLINGKSVCNGITSISRNILSRIGVSVIWYTFISLSRNRRRKYNNRSNMGFEKHFIWCKTYVFWKNL